MAHLPTLAFGPPKTWFFRKIPKKSRFFDLSIYIRSKNQNLPQKCRQILHRSNSSKGTGRCAKGTAWHPKWWQNCQISKRPLFWFNTPPVGSKRPPLGSERPPFGSKRPPFVSKRPSFGFKSHHDISSSMTWPTLLESNVGESRIWELSFHVFPILMARCEQMWS